MEITSPKNTFRLQLKSGQLLTLTSDFDSGNLATAELAPNGAVLLSPAHDCAASSNPSHSKGWFHFSAQGPPGLRVKWIVRRMQVLASAAKVADYFRPVTRVAGEEWTRVEQAVVVTREEDTELQFESLFGRSGAAAFAYSYPFSHADCETALRNAAREARLTRAIYYHDQVVIRSLEGRPIHLLTLSSQDDRLDDCEEPLSCKQEGEQPARFGPSKKIALITARVHPGEAPASHTFNGLLRFLLSSDARAHLLRKHFVFKLVPMLNPDGVFHGHHRMDTLGQNLNRFYDQAEEGKQPAVWAVRQLGERWGERLGFYLDLHAHPQRKGNFIYGNAFEDAQQQAQTQLYARLLALNCAEFDYAACSFSRFHMNARDKNEELTKEGCGRVVFMNHLGVAHAYTLECGFTCSNSLNDLPAIDNAHRRFDRHAVLLDELDNLKSPYYQKRNPYFTPRAYQNLGKNTLVALLDLHQLNPASRVNSTPGKTIAALKQEISEQLIRAAIKEKPILRSPIAARTAVRASTRGILMRAPSVDSSKEVVANRLRHRTLAKVNIGLF